jgi:multidrug transporter EmrE-like cation transporter
MTLRRRREDQPERIETPWGRLMWTLRYGSLDFALLIGGAGLILWALAGVYFYQQDLQTFSLMYVFGSPMFWAAVYLICGFGMLGVVACDWPRWAPWLGATVSVVWAWTLIMRYSSGSPYQTGNVTTIIYIVLGFLIVTRSARR